PGGRLRRRLRSCLPNAECQVRSPSGRSPPTASPKILPFSRGGKGRDCRLVRKGGNTVLSREENELLTRVGPGTAMGELMRRYWIPAAFTDQVAAPDGPPLRVRLM